MTGTPATVGLQLCKTKGQYMYLDVYFPPQSGCHRDCLVLGPMGRHSEACTGHIYTQILKYLYFTDNFILFEFIYYNTKNIFYYRRAQIRTFQDEMLYSKTFAD